MKIPFGKYTLLKRLGGGGMAEVFKARLHGPEGFEKDLALKLILPHFSDDVEFVKMFIREATLAARLDHANIVRIHEFDQIEGRYYIAMELVDGKDLRQVMARVREVGRPIGIAQAMVVALEVCQGLAFAHGELTPGAAEIVHRDVSPHNIIISRAGEVKITDFGIAKLASAVSVTRTGVIKGKVAYMSPQQARGEPLDRRSDLFSLGCVLWELLTGQRLFAGDNDMAILENLQHGPIHPPSAHNPEVPKELDEVMLKLLQRDPKGRYHSAGASARALDPILLNYPGINRATLLAELYQELFGPGRAGTGILPLVPEAEEIGRPGPVEPVGPEAETKPSVDQPASSGLSVLVTQLRAAPFWRRWVVVVAGLLVLTGLVTAGIILWLQGPKKTPVDATAATATKQPILPTSPPATPQALQLKIWATQTPSSVTPDRPKPKESSEEAVGEGEPKNVEAGKGKVDPPGRLNLNAIPWAKVYWQQRLLGDTPLENVALPGGEHLLLLVNQELGVTKTIKVRIRPGRPTRQVVNLRK